MPSVGHPTSKNSQPYIYQQSRHLPSNQTFFVPKSEQQKARRCAYANKKWADAKARQLAQYSEPQGTPSTDDIEADHSLKPFTHRDPASSLSLSLYVVNPKLIPNRRHQHGPFVRSRAIHHPARRITRFGHLPLYRHSQLIVSSTIQCRHAIHPDYQTFQKKTPPTRALDAMS